MSDCLDGALYPLSLDDPARQLAYNEDSAAKWLRSRGCSCYPLPSSIIVDPWLYPPVPRLILEPESDTAQRCHNACFTGIQAFTAGDLFQARLPDHFTVDETENDLVHVMRAIHFTAAVRERHRNLGEPANLPSAWPILYNSFFEDTRADIFLYSHVDISHNPRWSVRGEITSGISHIVPDTVFYISVIGTLLDRSSELGDATLHNQLRIEYDEPLGGIAHSIRVPMLVVEYVKTNLFADDGEARHLDHLLMAMLSASGFYKTLGISHIPVFGLLVERAEATLFAGCESDYQVEGMRHSKLTTFSVANPFDALRLRLLLVNLLNHATLINTDMQAACPEVLEAINNGSLHRWRDLEPSKEECGPPERNSYIEEWCDSLWDDSREMNPVIPGDKTD